MCGNSGTGLVSKVLAIYAEMDNKICRRFSSLEEKELSGLNFQIIKFKKIAA